MTIDLKNIYDNNGKEHMLFSVVMLAYNHQDFIADAIRAIYYQDYQEPFELIILDDSSNDNTSNIIHNLLLTAPLHIHTKFIRHKKNIGSIENFNYGIMSASGKIIVVADGDDISYQNRLSTLADRYNKTAKSLYISNADILNNGEITGKKYNQNFILDNISFNDIFSSKTPVFGASYAFERQLFIKYGNIDSALVTGNNVDQNIFWRAITSKGIEYIKTPLLKYRKHNQGKTINKGNIFNIQDNYRYHLNRLGNLIYVLDYIYEEHRSSTLRHKIKNEINSLNDINNNLLIEKEKIIIKNHNEISVNGISISRNIKALKKLKIRDFLFVLDEFLVAPENKFSTHILPEFKNNKLTKNEILFIYFVLRDSKNIPFSYTLYDIFCIMYSILKWKLRVIKTLKSLRWSKTK